MLGELYRSGADPALLLQDLLDLTHWLTRIKLVPQAADDPAAAGDRAQARPRAGRAGSRCSVLARCWQMLLKGLGEVQAAPSPLQAAEMALIRLTHAADLPPPGELARRCWRRVPPAAPRPRHRLPPRQRPAPTTVRRPAPRRPRQARRRRRPAGRRWPSRRARVRRRPEPGRAGDQSLAPQSFVDIVALADAQGDLILRTNLVRHVHLVHFEPGRIEFRPAPRRPPISPIGWARG